MEAQFDPSCEAHCSLYGFYAQKAVKSDCEGVVECPGLEVYQYRGLFPRGKCQVMLPLSLEVPDLARDNLRVLNRDTNQ